MWSSLGCGPLVMIGKTGLAASVILKTGKVWLSDFRNLQARGLEGREAYIRLLSGPEVNLWDFSTSADCASASSFTSPLIGENPFQILEIAFFLIVTLQIFKKIFSQERKHFEKPWLTTDTLSSKAQSFSLCKGEGKIPFV